jgi:hypothetical protein
MTGSLAIICANSAHDARGRRPLRRIEPVAAAAGGEQDRRQRHERTNRPQQAPHGLRAPSPLSAVAAQILGARGASVSPSGYEAYAKAARLLDLQSNRVDVTGI